MGLFQRQRLKLAIHHVIRAGAQFHGSLVFRGGLHIDGQFHGSLLPEGDQASQVSIGPEGQVRCDQLQATHLLIQGTVVAQRIQGDLIVLGPTARVEGNLVGQQIEIQAGAKFQGQVQALPSPVKTTPSSNATTAKARLMGLVSPSERHG